MLYVVIGLIIISFLITTSDLKSKNMELSERLNKLADATGHPELSTVYISEALKEVLTKMKQDGNSVGAVKLLRDNTSLDLVKAKQYVDGLGISESE